MSDLYASYKVMESNEGQALQTISSREVADMMEVRHCDLLEKIDKINKDFNNGKIRSSKYWIESTYNQSNNGKKNREFQVTKRGCEFLAHKSTGTKGNLFTAKYMDRFSEMEQQLNKPKQLSPMELLKLQYKALEEHEQKIEQVKHELDDYIDNAPLFQVDCKEVQAEVKRKGTKVLGGYRSPAYLDNSLRGKVYADIQRELKRQFGVNRYEAIKRKDYEKALIIISNYEAPFKLQGDIELKNSQIGLELEKAGVTNE